MTHTWTLAQEMQFKKWFVENYQNVYKTYKTKTGKFSAEWKFEFFNMNYGLKRNDL